MTKKTITNQLMHQPNHQTDKVKNNIQTSKYYFKARLSSLNPCSPVSEWVRPLSQVFLTLTLLGPSNRYP